MNYNSFLKDGFIPPDFKILLRNGNTSHKKILKMFLLKNVNAAHLKIKQE